MAVDPSIAMLVRGARQIDQHGARPHLIRARPGHRIGLPLSAAAATASTPPERIAPRCAAASQSSPSGGAFLVRRAKSSPDLAPRSRMGMVLAREIECSLCRRLTQGLLVAP